MEMVHAKYLCSLVKMVSFLHQKNLPHPWDIQGWAFQNRRSSLLPKMREDLVDEAISKEYTHILFIDSDMEFPHDTLHRLISWKKDVVAVNAAIKQIPSCSTARSKPKDPTKDFGGEPIYTQPPGKNRQELERVWRVGTGICLVTTAACRKISKPRFPVTWHKENQEYQGEDWNFFRKLDEAGIKIYIDHGLSWHINHIGSYDYNHALVYQQQIIDERMGTHFGQPVGEAVGE